MRFHIWCHSNNCRDVCILNTFMKNCSLGTTATWQNTWWNVTNLTTIVTKNFSVLSSSRQVSSVYCQTNSRNISHILHVHRPCTNMWHVMFGHFIKNQQHKFALSNGCTLFTWQPRKWGAAVIEGIGTSCVTITKLSKICCLHWMLATLPMERR